MAERNSIVRWRWLAWVRLPLWPLAMSLCFSSPMFNSSTMLTFCQVFVFFSLTLLWAKPVWFLCLFGLPRRPKAGRVYKAQAPVIQTLDNAIYRIFIYLLRFGNSKQGHYGRPVKVPPPPRLIRDRPPHPGLRPPTIYKPCAGSSVSHRIYMCNGCETEPRFIVLIREDCKV